MVRILLALALPASALVAPGPRNVAAAGAVATAPGARRPTALSVNYLSDIEDEDAKQKWWDKEEGTTESSDPRAHTGVGASDSNAGPVDYEGFIDAEGFDGGDGQVGVVGDGTISNLETFDNDAAVKVRRRNAVGGSESKLNAKNAWGTSSGYADSLKKKGMVSYNEYGEDMLQAKRQQLENYRNQQELRLQKDSQMAELASLQGKAYTPLKHGAYQSTLEANDAASAPAAAARDAHAVAAGGLVAGEVTSFLSIASRIDGRGGTSFEIDNELSQYSDFAAGFVAGSNAAFTVTPASGTLNRRGGDPAEFVVKFQPSAYEESFDATLVVETDDSKWTYEITGKLQ